MKQVTDVFGPGSNFKDRFIEDYGILKEKIDACKKLGLRIILTSGTFDLLHVGHSRYLEQAKQYGDILVVGLDSDAKVKSRKGPNRPIVPEKERAEVVAHLRYPDLVVLKEPTKEKWFLIKTVAPDVLIATKETYTEEELIALKEFCGEVVVLEPQAQTSTSARIRLLMIDFGNTIKNLIDKHLGIGGGER